MTSWAGGRSDKPAGYPHTAVNQMHDLDAVIDQLGLEQVVLVAHDASGPPAIDWALANPHRVAALILLNTYYGWMPSLRRPEAIFLYSTPVLRNLARFLVRRSDRLDRVIYSWQVGRFIRDDDVRREVVPALYGQFRAARPAFWRQTPTCSERCFPGARCSRSGAPSRDRCGSSSAPRIPTSTHESHDASTPLFPASELFLLPQGRHYVQVDEPEEVARLILTAPVAAAELPASPAVGEGMAASSLHG